MKASELLAITGLSMPNLALLLKDIGVDVTWQALRAQDEAFKKGKPVDAVLTTEQAKRLLERLESPSTDLEQRASRIFMAVAPYFRGHIVEKGTPFETAPPANPITGADWINNFFKQSTGPVSYNRSALEVGEKSHFAS